MGVYFTDRLYRTYGPRGPLVYVLQESSAVPSDVDNTLYANSYNGKSGSIHEELVTRFFPQWTHSQE